MFFIKFTRGVPLRIQSSAFYQDTALTSVIIPS